MKKSKVGVLFGGRSGEHAVSCVSAASILRNLDSSRFELVPISISSSGRWTVQTLAETLQESPGKASSPSGSPAIVVDRGGSSALIPLAEVMSSIDVAFPVLHGTFGEDGTIQGLFEMAGVPYVGSGVLGSSVGMDKEISKILVERAGVPVVPYFIVDVRTAVVDRFSFVRERIQSHLGGYPVFVKPANLGSSVGIHKVRSESTLLTAINDAFLYDDKLVIERGLEIREIELSVLDARNGDGAPRVSIAGEIIPKHEFYSYEAKYLDESGALVELPAKMTAAQLVQAQEIAKKAFLALNLDGLARVDLFLTKDTSEFYFNEVNTMPGFTSISMYPKMWAASGLEYSKLLTELIEIAMARFERRNRLKRDWQV